MRLSPLKMVGIFAYRLISRLPGTAPKLNKVAYALAGALLDQMGPPTGADVVLDAGQAAERVNLLLRNLADDLGRIPVTPLPIKAHAARGQAVGSVLLAE